MASLNLVALPLVIGPVGRPNGSLEAKLLSSSTLVGKPNGSLFTSFRIIINKINSNYTLESGLWNLSSIVQLEQYFYFTLRKLDTMGIVLL